MNFKNSWITPAVAIMLLIILSEYASAVPAVSFQGKNLEENEVLGARSNSEDYGSWNVLLKMLDDCAEKDFFPCVGVKSVTIMNKAARMADIQVFDGVSFIKTEDPDDGRSGRALMTEDEIQNSLDQDPAQKTSRLLELLLEAATRVFKSHVFQLKFPQITAGQVQRALQEARGKKKILKAVLPIVLALGAKLFLLVPIAFAVVGFMAFSALIGSKIALIIIGIVALQKLFSGGGLGGWGGGKNGWSTGGGSGWNSAGLGSGWNSANTGGWSTSGSGSTAGYYRSFDGSVPADAHQMAYKSQIPQNVNQ